ncbi:MAG TPA: tetratricopeptide repeat protein [Myxococcota bacterium]|nr:tetratricopeptide repeat protein [Myxococcota bacterium]
MTELQKGKGSSLDKQIRDYLQILKQDPRSRVFAPLAGLILDGGNPAAAEKVCRMGLEVNPDFTDGHLVHASVLAALGRPREALTAVKTALELNPHCAQAYATAAEVYLANGKAREASAACMKAIDIDSENSLARKLLKQIGKAGMLAAGGQPREQVKATTREFRAVAGTSPGQRLGGKPPSPASLFGDELADASNDAIERVSTSPQPFSALSSGSQPAVAPTPADSGFEVPTKPEKSRRAKAHSGTPIPSLPAYPQVPEPVASRRPGPLTPGGPRVTAPPTGGINMPLADEVQAVIDAYGDEQTDFPEDEARLKVPRSGRLKLAVGMALALAALAAVVFLGTRTHRKKAARLKAPVADLAAGAFAPPVETPRPAPAEQAGSPAPVEKIEVEPEPTDDVVEKPTEPPDEKTKVGKIDHRKKKKLAKTKRRRARKNKHGRRRGVKRKKS